MGSSVMQSRNDPKGEAVDVVNMMTVCTRSGTDLMLVTRRLDLGQTGAVLSNVRSTQFLPHHSPGIIGHRRHRFTSPYVRLAALLLQRTKRGGRQRWVLWIL